MTSISQGLGEGGHSRGKTRKTSGAAARSGQASPYRPCSASQTTMSDGQASLRRCLSASRYRRSGVLGLWLILFVCCRFSADAVKCSICDTQGEHGETCLTHPPPPVECDGMDHCINVAKYTENGQRKYSPTFVILLSISIANLIDKLLCSRSYSRCCCLLGRRCFSLGGILPSLCLSVYCVAYCGHTVQDSPVVCREVEYECWDDISIGTISTPKSTLTPKIGGQIWDQKLTLELRPNSSSCSKTLY